MATHYLVMFDESSPPPKKGAKWGWMQTLSSWSWRAKTSESKLFFAQNWWNNELNNMRRFNRNYILLKDRYQFKLHLPKLLSSLFHQLTSFQCCCHLRHFMSLVIRRLPNRPHEIPTNTIYKNRFGNLYSNFSTSCPDYSSTNSSIVAYTQYPNTTPICG